MIKKTNYIETVLKEHFSVANLKVDCVPVSGGDIHSSVELNLTGGRSLPNRLFGKFNSDFGVDVLKTEFESLKIINELLPSLYPQALLFDRSQGEGGLIMQFHNLTSLNNSNAADAGRALAEQHKQSNGEFGWVSDNYIGMTPQSNQWTSNWVDFFREQRLLPMLERAKVEGLSGASASKVGDVIASLNEVLSHEVIPSLVHGDLWSGNLGFDRNASKPLFYDPAPYYGDREVDIAMTELFGRQPDTFYHAYDEVWPLDSGYEDRRAIYNLYHALNHVVLFGLSYSSLVDGCLNQIHL